jgi:hypothetical protein
MPFIGFHCDQTNKDIPPQACIACARQGALPGCEATPAILAGIVSGQRSPDFSAVAAEAEFHSKLDLGISVTELLGCQRKRALEAQVDWYETWTSLYYSFRGSLFHTTSEYYAGQDKLAIAERRLFWFFSYQGKSIGLSGQPDLLLYRETGWHLIDYKTVREVPNRTYRYLCPASGLVIYDTPFKVRGKKVHCPHCRADHPIESVTVQELLPQPRGKHIEQAQLYRLLVDQNRAELANAVNARFEEPVVPSDAGLTSGELSYMDMSGAKRIPLPLWDESAVANLLARQLDIALQEGLPEILQDPAQLWECDYCPVRSACEQQVGGPVGNKQLQARLALQEVRA